MRRAEETEVRGQKSEDRKASGEIYMETGKYFKSSQWIIVLKS